MPKEFQTEELKTITRQYFAAITGIDSQFKRIYDYLKENHMEEDTLIVLSADHGEMLGSHGLMSKNSGYTLDGAYHEDRVAQKVMKKVGFIPPHRS